MSHGEVNLYAFGVCVAYTSLVGTNCSLSAEDNEWAVFEATCLAYDAVLAVAGGTRLNCSVPSTPLAIVRSCTWDRVNHSTPFRPPFHPHPRDRPVGRTPLRPSLPPTTAVNRLMREINVFLLCGRPFRACSS